MTDKFTAEQRHRCMAANKSKDTKPEIAVRKFLFAKGLRYRLNVAKLPGKPDIVLKRHRAVVFVDGCFWHGHEGCSHFKMPQSNTHFWEQKIRLNYARDIRVNVELKLLGWNVIRVWECELEPSKKDETLNNIYHKIVGKAYDMDHTPLHVPEAAEEAGTYH